MDTYIQITDARGVKVIVKLPIVVTVVLPILSGYDWVDVNGAVVTSMNINTGQSITLQLKGRDQIGSPFPINAVRLLTMNPVNSPVKATYVAPDKVTFLGLTGATAGQIPVDFSADVS